MLDWTPFVLQIDAVVPGRQGGIVDDCQWVVTELDGRHANGGREHQRMIVNLGPLATEIVADANRVRCDGGIGKITLGAARPIAAKRPRGDAIVNQVTRLIRMKRKGRITREAG